MIAEGSFVDTAQVVGIVRIGVAVFLAEVAGEHAHLIEQVDGSQRCIDIGTNDNNGQMAWQATKQVAAYRLFSWSDQ